MKVKGRINLFHKSHSAPVPYPTMHHFVTEMCTFLLQNGALWDMCNALWDGPIDRYQTTTKQNTTKQTNTTKGIIICESYWVYNIHVYYIRHSWYTSTGPHHQDCCRCPGVIWAAGYGHQQPTYWLDRTRLSPESNSVTQISCYSHETMFGRGLVCDPVDFFVIGGFALSQ